MDHAAGSPSGAEGTGGSDAAGLGGVGARLGRSLPFVGPLFAVANVIYKQAEMARSCKENCRILASLVRSVMASLEAADAAILERHEVQIQGLHDVLERVRDFVQSFGERGWFMRLVTAGTRLNDFKHLDTDLRSQISAVGLAIQLAPNAGRYTDEEAALREYVERNGGVDKVLASQHGKNRLSKMLGVEAQVLSSELASVAEQIGKKLDASTRRTSEKLNQLDEKLDKKMDELVDALFESQGKHAPGGKENASLASLKASLPAFVIGMEDIKMKRVIGEGGFGTVHDALMRGTHVAVKVLHAHRLHRASIKDLIREANILSQLKHPNVMAFYGVVLEPPTYAMVMQYLGEGSIMEKLGDPDAELPWSTRIRWALGLSSGVAYLHSCDPVIIHGDIKSANVLLDARMSAVLCDFGMAKIKTESSASTASGGKGITVKWTPPEIFDGERKSKASDVYSMAVTLWEIAMRELPLPDMPDPAYVQFVMNNKRPKLPSPKDTGCPAGYPALIERCWKQRPGDRLSAQDALRLLDAMFDDLYDNDN